MSKKKDWANALPRNIRCRKLDVSGPSVICVFNTTFTIIYISAEEDFVNLQSCPNSSLLVQRNKFLTNHFCMCGFVWAGLALWLWVDCGTWTAQIHRIFVAIPNSYFFLIKVIMPATFLVIISTNTSVSSCQIVTRLVGFPKSALNSRSGISFEKDVRKSLCEL